MGAFGKELALAEERKVRKAKKAMEKQQKNWERRRMAMMQEDARLPKNEGKEW